MSDMDGPEANRITTPREEEHTESESMRSNPEVMGRSEPAARPATERVQSPQTETWPEMDDIRARFDALQSAFIDDPRAAVDKAEHLMDDMFEKMRERVQSIHRDIESNGDTEHLRLAMRGYREMISPMATPRAA